MLAGMPGLRTMRIDYESVVPFSYATFIGNGQRDRVRAALQEEGIETGVQYKPNHLLTKYGAGSVSLPVTEAMYEEELSLPMHPLLTLEEQERTVHVIKETLAATQFVTV
jgi:dTDP-4-amino-4,6-dideoxygalactose transaminase